MKLKHQRFDLYGLGGLSEINSVCQPACASHPALAQGPPS